MSVIYDPKYDETYGYTDEQIEKAEAIIENSRSAFETMIRNIVTISNHTGVFADFKVVYYDLCEDILENDNMKWARDVVGGSGSFFSGDKQFLIDMENLQKMGSK